jgi:saccharopine dehydrogenase-like NADP-dependent oxidoreductase
MAIVLALGGCGGVGKVAVRTLLQENWCEKVIIADRSGEEAERLAQSLGVRTSAVCLDINDREALSKSMKGVDIVMNTIGPFYRYGKIILEAAVESKCHYVDICDDWEPTLEMLDLHERAIENRITAIIGLGATPGISNLLGVIAIRMLDQAFSLHTCWDISYAKPDFVAYKPSAATIHGIHQLTRSIPVHSKGSLQMIEPLQSVNIILQGRFNHPFYAIGHPESVTFPKYFKDLKDCYNAFSINRTEFVILRFLIWLVSNNLLSERQVATVVETIEHLSDTKKGQNGWDDIAKKVLAGLIVPPMFAQARGIKNGREAITTCSLLSAPAGGMSSVTALPLAIGTHWLASGKFNKHGVFPPEAIIDPELFFACLGPLCKPSILIGSDLILSQVQYMT